MASVRPELREQAEWLLDVIGEISPKHGNSFVDGETIQVGWSILSMQKQKAGMVVCEPDFAANPLVDRTEGVSQTLFFLAQQKDINVLTRTEPCPTLFSDRITYDPCAFSVRDVYMERVETDGSAGSAWYIGRVAEPDERASQDSVNVAHVFELIRKRPALMQVILLPPKHMVVFNGNMIEAVLNPENVELLSNGSWGFNWGEWHPPVPSSEG